MMTSLEVRSPLLDHVVFEFMARVPPRFKLDREQSKLLLKRAAGDLLHSASFWIALTLLPLVYLLVLSLIGVVGSATWSDDVRAGLAGSLISAVIGGLVGYYYGQTTSRNRATP